VKAGRSRSAQGGSEGRKKAAPYCSKSFSGFWPDDSQIEAVVKLVLLIHLDAAKPIRWIGLPHQLTAIESCSVQKS